jgi:hypothetical protein
MVLAQTCHYRRNFVLAVLKLLRSATSRFVVIIIIGSAAQGGLWPPQANVTSDLYLEHLPSSFYNAVTLCLPLPHQSILISVGNVLDLQGLAMSRLVSIYSLIATSHNYENTPLDLQTVTP